jgi:hypothetical protein
VTNNHEQGAATGAESIADTPPVYVRAVPIVNGILCSVGIAISLYVYRHFPHPSFVVHPTKTPWSESIESYLFVIPAAQALFFIVPLYQLVFWSRTVRRAAGRDAWFRANIPYLRTYYSEALHLFVSIVFVAFSVFLLCLTIYHARLVATGNL